MRVFNIKTLHYYYKSKYYYSDNLLSKYRDGKFYLELMETINRKKKIKTNIKIGLTKNEEVNETNLISKYGRPRHKTHFTDLLGMKILYFKEKIGLYKAKLEFHLLDDNLFFYNYTFPDITIDEKNKILEIIREKYLNGRFYDYSYCIVDNQDSTILINDDVSFSIYYVSNKKLIIKEIKEYVDFVETNIIKTKKNQKKLLFDSL